MTVLACRGCWRSPRTHLAQQLIPDLQGLSDPVGFLNKIPASTCFPGQCPCLFGVGLPKNFEAKQHTMEKKKKKSGSRPFCCSALPSGTVLPSPAGSARCWDGPGGSCPGAGQSMAPLCAGEAAGPGWSSSDCLDYNSPAAISTEMNVCRNLAASRGLVRDIHSPSSP